MVAAVALARLVARPRGRGHRRGHRVRRTVGELTTMALVPQVCDAVGILVAAGGIADAGQPWRLMPGRPAAAQGHPPAGE